MIHRSSYSTNNSCISLNVRQESVAVGDKESQTIWIPAVTSTVHVANDKISSPLCAAIHSTSYVNFYLLSKVLFITLELLL